VRLISLCPSNSEILFAIGAGEELVAVEKWTDYPPAATRLPTVGTEMDVDIDAVASYKPDLVLASLSVPGMEKNVAALQDRGLPHLVLDPHSIEEIYGDILRVGQAVGRESESRELVRAMRNEIAALEAINVDSTTRARLYIEWWPKPAISPGRISWTDEMIEIAGGRNIFADMQRVSGQVDYEEVAARDPEIILLCWCGIHRSEIDAGTLASRSGWSRINAVDNRRIHVVEEGWYGRPGPRIVDGIRQMAGLIKELSQRT